MQEKLEERLVQYKNKNDMLLREMVRHLQHWERSFSTTVSPLCDNMKVAFICSTWLVSKLSLKSPVCKLGPTGNLHYRLDIGLSERERKLCCQDISDCYRYYITLHMQEDAV